MPHETARTAFRDAVVLITGASSGIGAALAREFGRHGAALVLTARRHDRLQALAQEIDAAGGRALAVRADVTRDGDVEGAVAAARERFGRIDVVIANAGYGVVGRVDELELADYRRQFETNVFGVLRTVYASLEDLERVRGRLVVIGSVSGYLAFAGGSAYAMSKFALRALADSLRYELTGAGVAVTLISPGFVESEIHQVDNEGHHHPEVRRRAPRWLTMPTDRAAREIVHAVARRVPERIVTRHGRLAVFLQRHVPGAVAAGVRLFSMRARPEPGARSADRSALPGRRG